MKNLHHVIGKILNENPQLHIRVDCALSFVQRHLPKKVTKQCGIKGCVVADRIMALASDGSVYPCSQLIHPQAYAGNLLESDPQALWNESKALRQYRSFYTKKTFVNSWCGICQVKESCGGCRIFAMDGLGGDPDCPDPVLPLLSQIGKVGRRLDLKKYLEGHNVISVGEYMQRYGVSQKIAIKELNISEVAVSTSGKSARKKIDTYASAHYDVVRDVQDSIGHTSGGFPFAAYEQVAEWIEDPSYTENYPEWMKEKDENHLRRT